MKLNLAKSLSMGDVSGDGQLSAADLAHLEVAAAVERADREARRATRSELHRAEGRLLLLARLQESREGRPPLYAPQTRRGQMQQQQQQVQQQVPPHDGGGGSSAQPASSASAASASASRLEIDWRWNMGLPSTMGDRHRLCYFCAGLPTPLRATHTLLECPKRRRAGAREYTPRAMEAVCEELRRRRDACEQLLASLATAQEGATRGDSKKDLKSLTAAAKVLDVADGALPPPMPPPEAPPPGAPARVAVVRAPTRARVAVGDRDARQGGRRARGRRVGRGDRVVGGGHVVVVGGLGVGSGVGVVGQRVVGRGQVDCAPLPARAPPPRADRRRVDCGGRQGLWHRRLAARRRPPPPAARPRALPRAAAAQLDAGLLFSDDSLGGAPAAAVAAAAAASEAATAAARAASSRQSAEQSLYCHVHLVSGEVHDGHPLAAEIQPRLSAIRKRSARERSRAIDSWLQLASPDASSVYYTDLRSGARSAHFPQIGGLAACVLPKRTLEPAAAAIALAGEAWAHDVSEDVEPAELVAAVRRQLWEPRLAARASELAHAPCPLEGVVKMAHFLGCDPVLYPHLMWIVDCALTPELPVGWAAVRERPDAEPYYTHAACGLAMWEHPQTAFLTGVLRRLQRPAHEVAREMARDAGEAGEARRQAAQHAAMMRSSKRQSDRHLLKKVMKEAHVVGAMAAQSAQQSREAAVRERMLRSHTVENAVACLGTTSATTGGGGDGGNGGKGGGAAATVAGAGAEEEEEAEDKAETAAAAVDRQVEAEGAVTMDGAAGAVEGATVVDTALLEAATTEDDAVAPEEKEEAAAAVVAEGDEEMAEVPEYAERTAPATDAEGFEYNLQPTEGVDEEDEAEYVPTAAVYEN